MEKEIWNEFYILFRKRMCYHFLNSRIIRQTLSRPSPFDFGIFQLCEWHSCFIPLKLLTSVDAFLQVLPLARKQTEERQNENFVQPDLVRLDQDVYNLILF